MKKFFVFAFVVFSILPAFSQDSEENKPKKLFFDLFLGLNVYGEGMPKKVDETITFNYFGAEVSESVTDIEWGLENTKSTFFDIGLSATYLFTQKFGIYFDVAYLYTGSNLEAEFDGILGEYATHDGTKWSLTGIPVVFLIQTKKFDTSVNGVLLSIGPTFNLLKSSSHLLLFTPKFNLQHYVAKIESSDDGYPLFDKDTGQYQGYLPASYIFTYTNTELGAGIVLDYRGLMGNWYFTVKLGVNFDFYQFKTVTEEITITGLRNKIILEQVINSFVTNFSFVPVVGFGYSF